MLQLINFVTRKGLGNSVISAFFQAHENSISFSPTSTGQDQTKNHSPSTVDSLGSEIKTTRTQRRDRTILLMGNNRRGGVKKKKKGKAHTTNTAVLEPNPLSTEQVNTQQTYNPALSYFQLARTNSVFLTVMPFAHHRNQKLGHKFVVVVVLPATNPCL